MLCSYSVRTPVVDNLPLDYEIRAGIDWKAQDSKYNVKGSMCGLYEREIGIHGWGHDFNLTYEKEDKWLAKIFNNRFYYRRQFTSYDRQVKDMNAQTIDTGYRIAKDIEWFKIGYTVAFDHFDKGEIMYYNYIKVKWLEFELRINNNKVINTLLVSTEIPLKSKLYLRPYCKYLKIEDKEDWWVKSSLVYRI